MKKISSITGLFFCLLLLAHSSALAQTPSDTMTPAISRHPLKIKITPPGQERACQVKEEIIKRRFTKSINLVTQIITKFDSVAQRASDFYNQKLVPNGKALSQYNELITDINAKKATVQEAEATLKKDAEAFNCGLPDRQGQFKHIQLDIQMLKKALHEYRLTIKNLIVAVRSITGTIKISPAITTPVSPSPTTTL